MPTLLVDLFRPTKSAKFVIRGFIKRSAALDRLAGNALGGEPAELTKVIESDTSKWAPIVQALNLQTD